MVAKGTKRMERNGKWAARAGLGLLAGMLVATTALAGTERLAGTWTLVAADVVTPDGVRGQAYGDDPQGRMIVDAQGRYSIEILKSGRAKFASSDKRKGTPAEYQDAVVGTSAHYGSIKDDPAAGLLTFSIEQSVFPNWTGTVQVRRYVLKGDELSYQPAGPQEGPAPITVWRRVK
jgi:hypothetical protein